MKWYVIFFRIKLAYDFGCEGDSALMYHLPLQYPEAAAQISPIVGKEKDGERHKGKCKARELIMCYAARALCLSQDLRSDLPRSSSK